MAKSSNGSGVGAGAEVDGIANGQGLLTGGRTSGESANISPGASGNDAASLPPASSPASSSSSTTGSERSASASSSGESPKAKGRAGKGGLACPSCEHGTVPVYRTVREPKIIVRYRKCGSCGRSFKTIADLRTQDAESIAG